MIEAGCLSPVVLFSKPCFRRSSKEMVCGQRCQLRTLCIQVVSDGTYRKTLPCISSLPGGFLGFSVVLPKILALCKSSHVLPPCIGSLDNRCLNWTIQTYPELMDTKQGAVISCGLVVRLTLHPL